MERQAYTNPDTAFDNDLLMSSDINTTIPDNADINNGWKVKRHD